MGLDKKTSFFIQNIFFDENVKFYYARMLLDDISDSADIFPILREMKATIRCGTFSLIEGNKTKWAFTFSTPENIDIRAFTERLAATNVRPATSWEQDIFYLADGYGYSPEYPVIGYRNSDPGSIVIMTLTSRLWHRIMKAIDDQFGVEGTAIVMYLAGKEQGKQIGRKGGIGENFQTPKRVNDPNFEVGIKILFKSFGYCDIENILVDTGNNKVIEIRVHHSAFNIKNFNADEERKCDFQRGLFDGFFSTYLGNDHAFDESECMGEGKGKCVYINES